MAILNMFGGGGGVRIPLEPVTNLVLVGKTNSMLISWTDPIDKVASPGGEEVSEWAYTIVVRKQGSAPTSPTDGVQVLKETTRNQYSSTVYTDTGLTNDVTYYYAVYAFSTLGVASEGVTGSAKPTNNTITFTGYADPFTYPTSMRAAGRAGNYAIFHVGQEYQGDDNKKDAYSLDGTRIDITNLDSHKEFNGSGANRYWWSASSNGRRVLFAGGHKTATRRYNSDLTTSYTSNVFPTDYRYTTGFGFGDKVVVCGGTERYTRYYTDDDVFGSFDDIPFSASSNFASAVAKEHAFLVGGGNDSNVTRSSMLSSDGTWALLDNDLHVGHTYGKGATVSDKAVFLGGYIKSSMSNQIDIFDDDGTHITGPTMSDTVFETYGVSTPDFALFAGGKSDDPGDVSETIYQVAYIVDKNLTLTTEPLQVKRCYASAVAIDRTIFIGGGSTASASGSSQSYLDSVEMYAG